MDEGEEASMPQSPSTICARIWSVAFVVGSIILAENNPKLFSIVDQGVLQAPQNLESGRCV